MTQPLLWAGTQALVELGGRDGFLATFVPGDKSREEVAALARRGPAEDTPANRALGWARMCLLVLYFSPSGEGLARSDGAWGGARRVGQLQHLA